MSLFNELKRRDVLCVAVGIVNEPLFNPIHADPRWLPFLESIGKAPSQLDVIPFAVTLP